MKKNNGRNKDCNMQIEETIQAIYVPYISTLQPIVLIILFNKGLFIYSVSSG